MAATSEQREVKGVVTDVPFAPYGSKEVNFKIQTKKGNIYKVRYFGFFPVNVDDDVTMRVIMENNGDLTAVSRPFVQMPMNRDNIQKCFIRALRGTGFGDRSAEKLYNNLLDLAKVAGYGQSNKPTFVGPVVVGPAAGVSGGSGGAASGGAAGGAGRESPPKPFDSDLKTQTVNSTTKYEGDGVIAFLSEISSSFHKTRDPAIVKSIVGSTPLKEEQIMKLLIWWHQHRSLRRLHLIELTDTEINNCNLPLDDIYQICANNPYRLPSIAYEKCDRIMMLLSKKKPTVNQKLCGLIVRKIYDLVQNNGWTCVPLWLLKKQFPDFEEMQEVLAAEYGVIYEHKMAYLQFQHKVETEVAEYLNQKIRETAIKEMTPAVETPGFETAHYDCKSLTEEQKGAIQAALRMPISIVTGGGGSGKSLCAKEIVRNLELLGIPYVTSAFTGKAVSRLKQILQSNDPVTLDRMIARSNEYAGFQHIIIDEVSMVTTELFWRLIRTFGKGFKITFLGDSNQLPPISWGSLMRQMLDCHRIPVFYLTVNHRITPFLPEGEVVDGPSPGEMKYDRTILSNANALVEPGRSFSRAVEFFEGPGFYMHDGNMEAIGDIVTALRDAGIDASDLAIITPQNKDLKDLNGIVQAAYLEKEEKYIDQLGRLWCVGDRVMMIKNNYKINIMNGDEGIITRIEDTGVRVRFKDGGEQLFLFYNTGGDKKKKNEHADYEIDNLTCDMIQTSFSITIHKSQGSEMDFVILYIPKREGRSKINSFLNVNLIYTAITRTKKRIWIVGCMETLKLASKTILPVRYEMLAYRLEKMKDEGLEESLKPYIKVPEIAPKTDSGSSYCSVPGNSDEMYGLSEEDYEAFYADME
jgi:hypothetical protein